MAVLSSASFLATFPDGKKCVVLLQPQHCSDIPGTTLNERAVQHGQILAIETNGEWYDPKGNAIIDHRTIALLERAPTTQE